MNTDVLDKQDKDGGYYAIKGFLYQFDVTLMEILVNTEKKVRFEVEQDIDYDEYVIQVKHKESQEYAPSKIRAAVKQLIELSTKSKDRKFKLYCHFKDCNESITTVDVNELDKILGVEAPIFSRSVKEDFSRRFLLQFASNYQEIFERLLELIKETYSLQSRKLAIYYHAVFRTELSNRSINDRGSRELEKKDLDGIIQESSKIVFEQGYQNHISHNQYLEIIRQKHFIHKKAHITPHERVLIIECTGNEYYEDLIDIIRLACNKFYRSKKQGSPSPSPMLCFRGLEKEKLSKVKRILLDQGIYFFDGTFFSGDIMRIEKLLDSPQSEQVQIRFIEEEYLKELETIKGTLKTYQFYKEKKLLIDYSSKEVSVFINDIEDVKKLLA